MGSLRFIVSPSHGWLEVPLSAYPDAEECGTGYGYIDPMSRTVYLEEDLEAPAFFNVHPEVVATVDVVLIENDSAIRMLPSVKDARVTA